MMNTLLISFRFSVFLFHTLDWKTIVDTTPLHWLGLGYTCIEITLYDQ